MVKKLSAVCNHLGQMALLSLTVPATVTVVSEKWHRHCWTH